MGETQQVTLCVRCKFFDNIKGEAPLCKSEEAPYNDFVFGFKHPMFINKGVCPYFYKKKV